MITVRKAGQEDTETLVTLWSEFFELHKKIVSTKNSFQRKHLTIRENAPKLFLSYIKKKLRSPRTAVFVAEADGEPAGYCFCRVAKNLFYLKERFYGVVEDLYVRERFQGQGVASALKKEAMDWFSKKEVQFIYLTVFPGNKKATAIYKKWGFACWDIGMYYKLK